MSDDFVVTIVRESEDGSLEQPFSFTRHDQADRPMALDVLLQAQDQAMPDLAYRYGCRNGLCGVCTIDVNGKPKLACRTKLRNGDRLSALSSLETVRDLVINREPVNRQLRGRLPVPSGDLNTQNPTGFAAYQSLNRCIECYACLTGCPMHEKNGHEKNGHEKNGHEPTESDDNSYGNPYSLLKIQQVRLDPRSSKDDCDKAIDLGLELGMQECLTCKGCRCGVGIDLKKEVISPLVEHLKK